MSPVMLDITTHLKRPAEGIEKPPMAVDLPVGDKANIRNARSHQYSVFCLLGVLLLQTEQNLSRDHALVGTSEFELHVWCQAHGARVFEHVSLYGFVLNRILHGSCETSRVAISGQPY